MHDTSLGTSRNLLCGQDCGSFINYIFAFKEFHHVRKILAIASPKIALLYSFFPEFLWSTIVGYSTKFMENGSKSLFLLQKKRLAGSPHRALHFILLSWTFSRPVMHRVAGVVLWHGGLGRSLRHMLECWLEFRRPLLIQSPDDTSGKGADDDSRTWAPATHVGPKWSFLLPAQVQWSWASHLHGNPFRIPFLSRFCFWDHFSLPALRMYLSWVYLGHGAFQDRFFKCLVHLKYPLVISQVYLVPTVLSKSSVTLKELDSSHRPVSPNAAAGCLADWTTNDDLLQCLERVHLWKFCEF